MPDRAYLEVRVPSDNALVFLNGTQMNQTGTRREFVTPPLERGKEYRFTCAMLRIHPETKDFEIFCEGTSNPWGIAFDNEGSAFVSA